MPLGRPSGKWNRVYGSSGGVLDGMAECASRACLAKTAPGRHSGRGEDGHRFTRLQREHRHLISLRPSSVTSGRA